ncbi:MAG: hypothetical protein K0R00_2617 [Herbinix sp.]|jgi:hypothetical protein|nr:hypothetical protein [Herbinix sp.]
MLCDYYDMDEISELIADLSVYNQDALMLLVKSDLDGFADLTHQFIKLQLNQCPAYKQALIARHFLDKRYIIQFFQDYDVTSYIKEIERTRSVEYAGKEFGIIQEAITRDMEKREGFVMGHLKGEVSLATKDFDDYVKMLDKLHTFRYDNSIGTVENAKKFRSLVKELISQKRKCMPVYILPRKEMQQETLAKLRLIDNFDEAMDLTMELVNQIKDLDKDHDKDYWIDNTEERETFYSSGNKEKVNFISKALEEMGIDRKQYPNYIEFENQEKLSQPSKKLVLGLALYLEMPSPKANTPFEIKANIERFMNMHSYSLSSPFATLTDADELLDDDILYLIEAGLDIKVISYFMKNFAKTGQRLRAKKGSTNE